MTDRTTKSRHSSPTATDARRAFTLIELIVVVVLIAILAGVIAPRLLSRSDRNAKVEAAAVVRLVAIAARRDALSTEPVALDCDAERGVVRILVQRRAPDSGRVSWMDQRPEWREDSAVDPVVLTDLKVQEAAAAGVPLDKRHWTMVFPRSEPRPPLSLLLVAADPDRTFGFQIDLAPGTANAQLRALQSPTHIEPVRTQAIDLDATGRGNQPW